MITKKDWDSLPLNTKREILAAIYGDDFEQHRQSKELLYEYRHNFDFSDTGRRLKQVLAQIYRTAPNEVYIKVIVKHPATSSGAKFLASPTPVKKVSKPTYTPPQVCKWYVDYMDKGGDLCHVWVEADSKDDAISQVRSEYWDIDEIISVHQ